MEDLLPNRRLVSKNLNINKEKIIELYYRGLTCEAVGQQLGFKEHTIYNFLRRNSIKIRGRYCPRKYPINDNYFKHINTNGKAYLLGWLMSDGCIHDSGYMVSINLQKQDEQILKHFQQELETNKPIRTYKRKVGSFGGGNRYCVFTFNNKKIHYDLLQLGMTPRKSLTLKFPEIESRFIAAFMRGYIEGDGYITVTREGLKTRFKVGFLATKEFMIKAMEHFKILGLMFSISWQKRFKERNVNMWNAVTSNKEEIIRLLDWLYSNHNGLVLIRKYNNYLKMKDFLKKNPIRTKFITRFKKENLALV